VNSEDSLFTGQVKTLCICLVSQSLGFLGFTVSPHRASSANHLFSQDYQSARVQTCTAECWKTPAARTHPSCGSKRFGTKKISKTNGPLRHHPRDHEPPAWSDGRMLINTMGCEWRLRFKVSRQNAPVLLCEVQVLKG
jgi:hypothetical protein